MAKQYIDVLIDGKVYSLGGSETEGYVQQIATYLNGKIFQLKAQPGFLKMPEDYQSIMTYLNLADDYFKEKESAKALASDKESMEKETYRLKHEMVSTQMKLESLRNERTVSEEELETAKKAAKEAAEQAEAAKNEVQAQIERVKKEAQEQIEAVKKTAQEQVESARKEAQEQIERAKREVQDRVESAEKAAQDRAARAEQTAREQAEAAKKEALEQIADAKKEANDFRGEAEVWKQEAEDQRLAVESSQSEIASLQDKLEILKQQLEEARQEDLEVEKLPQIWNDKYEEYLGVRPSTDREGVLQDIHWSQGSIGYFPSYALGNAFGAQIYHQMKKELPVEKLLEAGNLGEIREYLRKNIHQYGKLKDSRQILRDMTGEDFNPSYYVAYLEEKYGRSEKVQ